MKPPEDIDTFLEQLKVIGDSKRKAVNLLFEEIQKDIAKQEAFIQTQNAQMREAEYSLQNLTDCLQVLKVAEETIPNLESRHQGVADREPEEGAGLMGSAAAESNLTKVAGVIEKTEIERLRRLIFRATKGKSFMYVQDYAADEDIQGASRRAVYIIMYWDGRHIRERISRICDSFQGERYELPARNEIAPQIERIKSSIADARSVLEQTRTSLRDQLADFDKIDGDDDSNISTIYIYKMFLAKEKALFQTLNMMKWHS